MFRDSKDLQFMLAPALDHYGLKDSHVDLSYAPEGFNLILSTSIQIPNHRPMNMDQTIIEPIMKVLEYRLGDSAYVKELTAKKESEIEALKLELDKTKEMLYSTLTTDKLSEL